MTRLTATIKWDLHLQWRNGFYYATFVVVFIWTLLLTQIPAQLFVNLSGDILAWLLPATVLGNLLIGTFYFIGGLLLLEKGEGTLEAQIVTPLRSNEYLASKIGTLTALAVLENSFLVVIIYAIRLQPWNQFGQSFLSFSAETVFSVLFFLAGLVLASAILCLTGFLVVIRYDSINEYLLPSILVTTLLMLPLVAYLTGWQNWLLYLHPLQASLLLLEAAWQQLPMWQLVYALIYDLLWVWFLFRAARGTFYQFVILQQGVTR